jgi:hypothetical protein
MDKIIKATYYGNTPETCRHIIRSYLEYSQFGKLIEEHPNNYQALEPFEGWWNEYISDGEDEFVEQDTTDWKQELRDFINDKSKKYDMPRDKHGYANLMAQLAANNEIDRKRLAALRARAQEEQDNG